MFVSDRQTVYWSKRKFRKSAKDFPLDQCFPTQSSGSPGQSKFLLPPSTLVPGTLCSWLAVSWRGAKCELYGGHWGLGWETPLRAADNRLLFYRCGCQWPKGQGALSVLPLPCWWFPPPQLASAGGRAGLFIYWAETHVMPSERADERRRPCQGGVPSGCHYV